MSVGEPIRQQFKVILWSVDRQRGAVKDKQGVEYPVKAADLAPGEVIHENDIVSGIAETWDRVREIQVEMLASGERKQFESVGPDPEAKGWTPNLGTPDTGLNGGRPHDGRFSHPKSGGDDGRHR